MSKPRQVVLSDCYVRTFGGEWHCRTEWHESGVWWLLFHSFATGNINAGLALLEGEPAMAKKAVGRNGVVSIAEALLARQKDALAKTHEASDEEWLANTPAVHEMLTRVLRLEKKVLQPASVLIFARSGGWRACLSHKGLDLKWWGEGPTIKSALVELERSCKAEMGQEEEHEPGINTEP